MYAKKFLKIIFSRDRNYTKNFSPAYRKVNLRYTYFNDSYFTWKLIFRTTFSLEQLQWLLLKLICGHNSFFFFKETDHKLKRIIFKTASLLRNLDLRKYCNGCFDCTCTVFLWSSKFIKIFFLGTWYQGDVHKTLIFTVLASKVLRVSISVCEYFGLQALKGSIFRTLWQERPEKITREPGKINCQ